MIKETFTDGQLVRILSSLYEEEALCGSSPELTAEIKKYEAIRENLTEI